MSRADLVRVNKSDGCASSGASAWHTAVVSKPETPQPPSFSLRFEWPEDQPAASPANQFAVSMGLPTGSGPDALYLSVGHAAPPLLSGSPEAVALRAREIGVLPINVLGRYVFTRGRLEELIDLLKKAALQYDLAQGGEQNDHDELQ